MNTYRLSQLPTSMPSGTQPMGSPVMNPSQHQQPQSVPATSGNPRDRSHEYVKGYPRLAYFFSECPQYFHLRSFSALSARALLYRQHELLDLEKQLIALENGDSGVPERRIFNTDFGAIRHPPQGRKDEADVRRQLYERLIKCTRDYEKALLRFDTLGQRGWDPAALEHVQRWLEQQQGCGFAIAGIDSELWGTGECPEGHAPDLISVVQQPESSVIVGFLRHKYLAWSHRFPDWLRWLLFWSNRQPDRFGQRSHKSRSFRTASQAIGNIATSIFVYGAVVILTFVTGQSFGLIIVLGIALVVTFCHFVFQNQQFISMLGTLFAVLVALYANNVASNQRRTD